MIVSRPVVSSMRSRQTGQVGSSTRDGVGGATGLVEREAEVRELDWLADGGLVVDPLFAESALASTASISTDFTNTTWQVSGW